jgi:hypothetical protein
MPEISMGLQTTRTILRELLTPEEPPSDYAVLTAQGYQTVPRIEGSLPSAWIKVATRFSRANFAGLVQGRDNSIITLSLAAGMILGVVASVIEGIATLATANQGNWLATPRHIVISAIAGMLLSPISYLVGVLGQAVALTYLMHPTLGTFRQRLARVLRPLSLSLIGIGVVAIARSLVQAGITLVIPHPTELSIGTVGLGYGIGQCGNALAALGFIVYSMTLTVQSTAVGSNLPRFVVFILTIVASALIVGFFTLLTFLIGALA